MNQAPKGAKENAGGGKGTIALHPMQTIAIKRSTAREEESLCRSCYSAHIQKGFRESEEAVFCCFSKFRAVPFKVAECTDFSHKNLPTRGQMEDIALIIPVEPARKPAGFAGVGCAGDPQEDELISVSE